jgi:protein-disulfide isomerase
MTHLLTRRHVMALMAAFAAMGSAGFAQTDTAAAEPVTVANHGIGDAAAKVKIVEYLSFTCPHCAAFHGEVYPKLKADYIDTGKVRLDYHEVYFDQLGLLGGMLARCGGELRYMGITDILLDKQRDWAGAADMNAAVAQLKKIGLAAGMDDATVDACLRDQAVAEALVANYQKNIETDYPGDTFSGTPSFIINGTQHSNMDYAELKAIIDAELAK